MRNIHDHNEYHKYSSTTKSSNNKVCSGGENSSLSNNEEFKGFSLGGKVLYDATKDSNEVSIIKCILVTLFCIGGIVLPVAPDMGAIGTLICIFGGLGISVLILKNV